ncbi:MAG: helix-turn-helix domain-containing protein [Lachnospiraceae bacterium]|nr:helix-turn-helix domain-containing protein [Lachnospiraceae bacterium]
MLANQVIMNCLSKIRESVGADVEVYTPADVVISSSGTRHASDYKTVLRQLEGMDDEGQLDGKIYFRVEELGRLQYLVAAENSPVGRVVGKMTAMQLETLLNMNEDLYDKDNFFKNLLLDNLLLVDIYSRTNKLHLDIHAKRVVYLVELGTQDTGSALEVVRSLLADDENSFVTAVDERNIVIVRQVRSDEDEVKLNKTAHLLADTIQTEMMQKVRVSYGKVAEEIRKVANSYKEAKIAMSVGKIFNPEQVVTSYESLGIGRLIYQLPLPMCKMFIEEIFKDQAPDKFDEETLSTINEYFANSLNVSETSRKLYIHRNTLVYRLDKIEKMTGLDIRCFDDAITFKIALMVVKYMHYMENQDI